MMTHIKTDRYIKTCGGRIMIDENGHELICFNSLDSLIAEISKDACAELRKALEQAQKRIAELEAQTPAQQENKCDSCGSYKTELQLHCNDCGKNEEFCDSHCTWLDHHQDCKLINGLTQEQTDRTMSVKGLSQSAQPIEPAGKNEYGLDVGYFREKLSLIIRDIGCYKPDEMYRELSRLANVLETIPADQAQQPVQEPVATLLLGGIDGDEYGDCEIDWLDMKKIEAMQERLVHGSYPVSIPLYTKPATQGE